MPTDALDPAPGEFRGEGCCLPSSARPVWTSLDDAEARVLRDALVAGHWTASVPARWAKRQGVAYTFLGELATPSGASAVVVKRIPSPKGLAGALRLATGRTRAMRQVDGAVRLARIGLRTSTPLLVLRGEEEGRRFEWLVLHALEGEDLLRTLARGTLTRAELRATADRAGAIVNAIVSAGRTNRDHKLSNQVRLPDGDIGIVDTVDVRSGGGSRGAERMLLAMLREARGVDVLPGPRTLARCVRAAAGPRWREMFRSLSAIEAGLGDTTPEVDPLCDAR